MFVGYLLPQHVQAVKEMEHLRLCDIRIVTVSMLFWNLHGNRGVLSEFVDFIGGYDNWHDSGADAEPFGVGFRPCRYPQNRRRISVVQ